MAGSIVGFLMVAYVLTGGFVVVSSISTKYKYFDDSTMCYGSSYTGTKVFLSSYAQDAYLKAWDPSNWSKNPISGGCVVTFASYGSYGLKYSFDYGDAITDCSVTLEIYKSDDAYGYADETYNCYNTLPTYTQYTSQDYLTIKLINNYPYSTDFDFNLHIENYGTNYLSGGAIGGIIGGSIGFLTFIVVTVVVIVVVRRRRRPLVTQTFYGQGQPVAAAYPTPVVYGNPAISTTPGIYPPPATTAQGPPPYAPPTTAPVTSTS